MNNKKATHEYMVLYRDRLTFERSWMSLPVRLTENEVKKDHENMQKKGAIPSTMEIFAIIKIEREQAKALYNEWNTRHEDYEKTAEFKEYWNAKQVAADLKRGIRV